MTNPNEVKAVSIEDEIEYTISEFKENFFRQFNRTVFVTVEKDTVKPMHLYDMIDITKLLWHSDSSVSEELRKKDLLSKTRNRELVTYRQVLCVICRKYGYHLEAIGIGLNINHATVLHGITTVKNLLENKDKEVTRIYNRVTGAINDKQVLINTKQDE